MVIWAEIAHLLGALTPVTPLPALMESIVRGRCLWGRWLGLRADATPPPNTHTLLCTPKTQQAFVLILQPPPLFNWIWITAVLWFTPTIIQVKTDPPSSLRDNSFDLTPLVLPHPTPPQQLPAQLLFVLQQFMVMILVVFSKYNIDLPHGIL